MFSAIHKKLLASQSYPQRKREYLTLSSLYHWVAPFGPTLQAKLICEVDSVMQIFWGSYLGGKSSDISMSMNLT